MPTSAFQVRRFLNLLLTLVIDPSPALVRITQDSAAWEWAPQTFLTGPVVTFCDFQTEHSKPFWTLHSGVDSQTSFSLVPFHFQCDFRQTVTSRSRTWCDQRVGSSHLLTGLEYNYIHTDWVERHQHFSQRCGDTVSHNRCYRGWAPLTTLTGPFTQLTQGLDTLTACSNTDADLDTRHLDITGTDTTFFHLGVGSLLLWILAQVSHNLHTHFSCRRVGSSRHFTLARTYPTCDLTIGVGSHIRFALALGLILFFRLHLTISTRSNNLIFANWDTDYTGSLRTDSRGTALLLSAGDLSGTQQRIQDWRQTENRDWAPLPLFSGPKAQLDLDTASFF